MILEPYLHYLVHGSFTLMIFFAFYLAGRMKRRNNELIKENDTYNEEVTRLLTRQDTYIRRIKDLTDYRIRVMQGKQGYFYGGLIWNSDNDGKIALQTTGRCKTAQEVRDKFQALWPGEDKIETASHMEETDESSD